MAELKLSNSASSLLAADISNVATTLAISSGDEVNFPALSAGQWHPLTLIDGAGNRERMRCTARSGVTLTVVRAQEGTTAVAWSAGARVQLGLTAGAFHEHTADADRLTTGTVANAVLPARMKESASAISDIDAVAATGWYSVAAAVAGLPIAEDGYLWHVNIDADTAVQEYQPVAAMDRYGRRREAGSWGSWYISVLPGSQLNALAPVGSMMAFAGAIAPSGWLFCYGQAVNRETYAALWTAISSAHGSGDGSTTFNLPDLRGRVPAGKDDMGGTAAGRLTTGGSGVNGAALGAVGGAETQTLTASQMPAHTHAFTTGPAGAHAHNLGTTLDFMTNPYLSTGMTDDNGSQRGHTPGVNINTSEAPAHTHTGTTDSNGSGAAHPNAQPTIVLNWIIKY